MKMSKFSAVACGLIIALSSCSSGTNGDNAATENAPMPIERLDLLAASLNRNNSQQLQAAIDSMSTAIDLLIDIYALDADSTDRTSELLSLKDTPAFQIFGPDVTKRLPDMADIEQTIGTASQNAAALLPKTKLSRIYGVISPYRQGVIISDSTALVALNLYLGPDYAGYQGFENYFKATRRAERIPYDVMEGVIASAYPYKRQKDETALSKMIYNGALIHALIRTIPSANLSEAIGVGQDDLTWFDNNEAQLWRTIIDKDLLYDTSEIEASKLISPAPSTMNISPSVPARAGRYIGYRIVKSYVERHPETAITTLLSPSFYSDGNVLVAAQYSPK